MPPEFKHEPRSALLAGKDGLTFVRQILDHATKVLSQQGRVIVEAGHKRDVLEPLLTREYPQYEVEWLPVSVGSEDVFMLSLAAAKPSAAVGGKSKKAVAAAAASGTDVVIARSVTVSSPRKKKSQKWALGRGVPSVTSLAKYTCVRLISVTLTFIILSSIVLSHTKSSCTVSITKQNKTLAVALMPADVSSPSPSPSPLPSLVPTGDSVTLIAGSSFTLRRVSTCQ